MGNALTLFSPTIIERKACTEVAGPEDTNSLNLCVPVWKVKEETEKVGLKLTFRKLRSWHPVPSLHGK